MRTAVVVVAIVVVVVIVVVGPLIVAITPTTPVAPTSGLTRVMGCFCGRCLHGRRVIEHLAISVCGRSAEPPHPEPPTTAPLPEEEECPPMSPPLLPPELPPELPAESL